MLCFSFISENYVNTCAKNLSSDTNVFRQLCRTLKHTVYIYTVSQKNCATFIFTVTLANVGQFLKSFQCRNQKEMAHNKNEKFPTVA